VQRRVPEGDNRERYVCDDCSAIHYQNPRMVTGCLAEWEDRVLLCRRAIEPRSGLWTLPAGFMENGESLHEAAMRETLEEANARVELCGLYSLFNLPHVNQVFIIYRGRLLDLDFSPGEESLEVALFREHEIPWQELAFPMVTETLRRYFSDRAKGGFGLHTGTVVRVSETPRRHRIEML
jgi:ADP-ribose pyrophosphatase YjhB (NUDIX family)